MRLLELQRLGTDRCFDDLFVGENPGYKNPMVKLLIPNYWMGNALGYF